MQGIYCFRAQSVAEQLKLLLRHIYCRNVCTAALCSVLLCICEYSDLSVILIFFESRKCCEVRACLKRGKPFHFLLFVSMNFPMTA